jgi:hypothetical protein
MIIVLHKIVMGFLYLTSLVTLYGLSFKLSLVFKIIPLIIIFGLILAISYFLGGLI